jgi:ComF family protein
MNHDFQSSSLSFRLTQYKRRLLLVDPWMSIFKKTKSIISKFLPHLCILCGENSGQKIDLCKDCQSNLPWLSHACVHCAIPLSDPATFICGCCLKNPLPFYKTCILFAYAEVIKKLILALKFRQQLMYAHILGNLLVEKIQNLYRKEPLPQLIIPVPLHVKRLRKRGFNQSMEIARPIYKKLKIPIDYTSCRRVRNTAAQSTLPANQRGQNVKYAFEIKKPQKLLNQHIALLDDVMTTGHTLTELSRALYRRGVKRIDVWCCARAF